jgi:hypothetical protein
MVLASGLARRRRRRRQPDRGPAKSENKEPKDEIDVDPERSHMDPEEDEAAPEGAG